MANNKPINLGNPELNEALLPFMREFGLHDVLQAIATNCARESQFAADSEEEGSEIRVEAWAANAVTIDRILPLIINEETSQD